MATKLVTFDVYMALLDIQGSLTPVVANALDMDAAAAGDFVAGWRAAQMTYAAASNSLNLGHTPFRTCTRMGLDYLLARKGWDLDVAERTRLVLAWDRMTPWPEAVDLIHLVKAKGYATAILSNGDQDMLDAVAGIFEGGFDHVLSAETAGAYKPHPDVYDLPRRILGVATTEILHVAGASGDVLGARAFGMRCFWSNRSGDLVLNPKFGADYQASDLNGVLEVL